MSSTSLWKHALNRSFLLIPYFLVDSAAGWLVDLLNGTLISSLRSWPVWKDWKELENSSAETYLYGRVLSAQYCSWSFLDIIWYYKRRKFVSYCASQNHMPAGYLSTNKSMPVYLPLEENLQHFFFLDIEIPSTQKIQERAPEDLDRQFHFLLGG